jgi:hypothetical protein
MKMKIMGGWHLSVVWYWSGFTYDQVFWQEPPLGKKNWLAIWPFCIVWWRERPR